MAAKTKDRRKQRRKRFRKRQDRNACSSAAGLRVPPGMKIVQNHKVKMSEVLLDFADPIIRDDMACDQLRHALLLAATAWNSTFGPDEEGGKARAVLDSALGVVPLDVRELFESMYHFLRARKMAYFSDVQSMIMDVAVEDRREGPNVKVLSQPLDAS